MQARNQFNSIQISRAQSNPTRCRSGQNWCYHLHTASQGICAWMSMRRAKTCQLCSGPEGPGYPPNRHPPPRNKAVRPCQLACSLHSGICRCTALWRREATVQESSAQTALPEHKHRPHAGRLFSPPHDVHPRGSANCPPTCVRLRTANPKKRNAKLWAELHTACQQGRVGLGLGSALLPAVCTVPAITH